MRIMGPDRDALAREYSSQTSYVPDLQDLPELDDSSLLDRFLSKLCDRIKKDGLSSLYWVSGIHTQEISSAITAVLDENAEGQKFSSNDYSIVVKPSDSETLEPLSGKFDIPTSSMNEFYIDSFVIINGEAVLDVTPVSADDGSPEYNDDPTVVNLYIGLFNMLKNGTTT